MHDLSLQAPDADFARRSSPRVRPLGGPPDLRSPSLTQFERESSVSGRPVCDLAPDGRAGGRWSQRPPQGQGSKGSQTSGGMPSGNPTAWWAGHVHTAPQNYAEKIYKSLDMGSSNPIESVSAHYNQLRSRTAQRRGKITPHGSPDRRALGSLSRRWQPSHASSRYTPALVRPARQGFPTIRLRRVPSPPPSWLVTAGAGLRCPAGRRSRSRRDRRPNHVVCQRPVPSEPFRHREHEPGKPRRPLRFPSDHLSVRSVSVAASPHRAGTSC